MQGENAIPVPDRNVRLQITRDTGEVEHIRVSLVVSFDVELERYPDGRKDVLVAEVQRGTRAIHEKVGLDPKSRRRCCAVPLIEARVIRSSAGLSRQPSGTRPELGKSRGPCIDASFERAILQPICRLIVAIGVRSQTKELERREVTLDSCDVTLNRKRAVRPREDEQSGVVRFVAAS